MSNIFDEIAGAKGESSGTNPGETEDSHKDDAGAPGDATLPDGAAYTPRHIKAAIQELLKYGLLEADRKPVLYSTATTHADHLNAALEPLDLALKVDDVRGLAFLVVVSDLFADETVSMDDWSHPLVRRQRLTLEQSLLIAILRQIYLAHEQEAGIGASQAVVSVDELMSNLELFLGSSGSEARDQKRIRNLLENLRGHGVVSEIDNTDQVHIRPIITHLANPESLQALLEQLRQMGHSDDQASSATEI